MEKRVCPTEDEEEAMFSDWCNMKGFTHFHVPQETFTKSWNQKRHNKRLGVLAGVSDHWVVIPTPLHPKGSLLVIEFKRQFGNTPTNEQIEFLRDISIVDNVSAVCCYGADEAIKVVEELMVGDFSTFDKCWDRTWKIKENRAKKAENLRKSPKKTEKSKNDCPF